MESYVTGSSAIRAMFEEGARLAKIYGAENVYDFSLGNPNLDPPEEINQAIVDILKEEKPTLVHGYMNNAGYEDVRERIADHLNKKFSASLHANNILMTVGAAGGLNVLFKTLLDPQDEVIVFAPYFGEYRSYVANYSGKLVTIPPNTETFQPNLEALKGSITAKTKVILINSPNNPTGVVYSEDTLKALAAILTEKEKEFGTDIYLVADEPYRELVYDGVEVPYVPHFFKNTIIGYSYSKSLSLPGDRIGYLVVPSEVADFENLIYAASTANRIMGFVNAPSLMQRAVARCLNSSVDINIYNRNREALYYGLKESGYECIKPEGSFYLFVKAPIEDDVEFCTIAKDYRILIVPGSAFGCPGYVRIVYCVAYETIINALPQFKKLIEELKK